MLVRNAALATTLALSIAPTIAKATDFVVQPVQIGHENARFDRGMATVESIQPHGTVSISPAGMDHGSMVFIVAVFNGSTLPANIDTGDFQIDIAGQPVSTLTTSQLITKANHRAGWAKLGSRLIYGLAAGAAASQRDVYSASYMSRYGSASYTLSAPSIAGQLQAERIAEHGERRDAELRQRLDETRAAIGNETFQLTTVAPGQFYSGRMILKPLKMPGSTTPISFAVNWNGEVHRLAFQLAPAGTPQPAFVTYAVAAQPSVPPAPLQTLAVLPTPSSRPPSRLIDSTATIATPDPVTVAYHRPTEQIYSDPLAARLAAERGVHGRSSQGWIISE